MSTSKIKILIVDDSTTIQTLLCKVFASESDFEIVGLSSNPFEAIQVLELRKIDVILLDLEMPKMDGLTFLKKVSSVFEGKIIVMSGVVNEKPEIKAKLHELGAFESFSKPDAKDKNFFPNLKDSIRRAAKAPAKTLEGTKAKFKPGLAPQRLLLIASSTGGTEGVRKIINAFQGPPPATLIVQHMAAQFTKTFANTLGSKANFEVKEAEEGDAILDGRVLVAPGDFHMVLRQKGAGYFVELNKNPLVNSVRPAADPTFFSIPPGLAKNSTAVILSGMGKDGADGVKTLKQNGCEVIVESENTCVVFGMPKAAILTGCVDEILDIDDLAYAITQRFARQAA